MTRPGADTSGAQASTLAVNTAVFAWEWARKLVGTSWVPDDRTVVAERLRLLTEQAAKTLLAQDASVSTTGREIGGGVVAIGFGAPEALGRTLELMAGRFLTDLGFDPADPTVQARLSGLLGAIGVGFSRAARDRTLAEQDAIRSSQLVARQRAENALRTHMKDRCVSSETPTPPAKTGRTGRPRDLSFQEDLPAALERGEIVTYYQPIVTLAEEKLVGVEALARWQHPAKGILAPSVFLPIVAREGLFTTLGHRQREEACQAAVRWQREAGRPVFVGVNLAPAELREPGLVDDVRAVLDRTGLEPELLHLEITEDADLTDADLPVLRSLASTGVQLTLDDFGTGRSRLAALPSLPIRGLKLASAMLDPLRHLPFDAAQVGTEVLDSIVVLADRLGLTTTIEGIETEAEAGFARRLGVQRAQGWRYGRPVPVDDVPL